MSDMRNRPTQTAALVLLIQANRPIPLGASGFWFDGSTVYFVDAAGNQSSIGGTPITYGVVGDIAAVSPTASAGTLDKVARADHAHALAYGVVGDIAPVGVAAGAGVLNKAARADHQHAGGAAAIVYGDAADVASVGVVPVAGVLDKVARADHQHAIVTDGSFVAAVGDATPTAGLTLIRRITIPSGTNGNADVLLSRKERLVDAWLVMASSGVAGASLVLTNGAAPITNTLALSGKVAKDVVRFSSIDPALQNMPAGGTLRASWSSTAGSFSGCELYVLTMAVP
jgi:hypothetical protein